MERFLTEKALDVMENASKEFYEVSRVFCYILPDGPQRPIKMLSSYKSYRIFPPRANLVIANQRKLQVLALSLSTHKDVLLLVCQGFWGKQILYY